MEPLDPELRQLIDDGLSAAAPNRRAESRGLESLLAHIDAPPVTPSVPAAPMLGKLALVIATVVVAGGTWVAIRPAPNPVVDTPAPAEPQDPPSPSPSPSPSPEKHVVAPPLPQQPAVPVPAAEATPSATPSKPGRGARGPRKTDAPSPTTADALRAEAELIAKAESALDRGKPKQALALCDFHREGFDTPQLNTERNAIAASAACMLDPTKTGPAAAFVMAHPHSALATKVRQRCALRSDDESSPEP